MGKEIAQHFDFSCCSINFNHSRMSAGRESKLCAHQTIGAGHNIRFGVRERIIKGRVQACFHVVRNKMLVVVGDAAKLRKSDFLCRRARQLDEPLLDCELDGGNPVVELWIRIPARRFGQAVTHHPNTP